MIIIISRGVLQNKPPILYTAYIPHLFTIYLQLSLLAQTKSVASVKPTVSPKMISLKKIRDDPDISSPAPDVGVKSLAG